jgi:hypothetical protein
MEVLTMKKSIIKKLSLSKETVSNLNKTELNEAKGGMVTYTEDRCESLLLSCYWYCY